jgi:hypothetical protein
MPACARTRFSGVSALVLPEKPGFLANFFEQDNKKAEIAVCMVVTKH